MARQQQKNKQCNVSMMLPYIEHFHNKTNFGYSFYYMTSWIRNWLFTPVCNWNWLLMYIHCLIGLLYIVGSNYSYQAWRVKALHDGIDQLAFHLVHKGTKSSK